MKTSPTAAATAYSYLRFSDPSQADGDSIRRQTALREDWLRRHPHVHLDTSLSWLTKAYRLSTASIARAATWALFFELVEHRGRIREGSFLLIENMDRLSREKPVVGVNLLTGLLLAGIRVVQLAPDEIELTDDSDLFSLFRGQLSQARGHDESKTKSPRISQAWNVRRQMARKGTMFTRQLPAWVEARADGRLRLIPARAKIIRRMFQMALAGYGLMAIRDRLDADKVAPFGRSGQWQISYLHNILSDRRVLGEFQPRRLDDGKPEGEPIAKYFPAVVDEKTWLCARAGARDRFRRGRGAIGDRVNVFQGLIKGALDGAAYGVGSKSSKNPHEVLRSMARWKGTGRTNSFPLEVFESAVLRCLREIKPRDILPGRQGTDDVLTLSGELGRVESKIKELAAELLKGDVAALADVLRKLEKQKHELGGKLDEARQRAAHPLSESWGEAKSLLDTLAAAPDPKEARLRLRAALRRIVDGITLLVVPRGRVRLGGVQINFNGTDRCRTYLIYYRPVRANAGSRTEGAWEVFSLAEVTAAELDLRKPADAKELAEILEVLDLGSITD